MNLILRTFFWLLGWKVIGKVDTQIKKAILAVAPHNSWKDFLIGISSRAEILNTWGKQNFLNLLLGLSLKLWVAHRFSGHPNSTWWRAK
jgi:hypothetical protein